MEDKPDAPKRFSLGERIGMGACAGALLLLPVDTRLSALPLVAFLVLCGIAPFLPGFGFFLPVISRGRRDRASVALTFDDGPDPVSTPVLLDLLDRYQAKATFFVPGCKALRYPGLMRAILARGHTIGNHSYSHDIFLMCRSQSRLGREIEAAQQVFRRFGVLPLVFRPPVGITNPRLPRVLDRTGLVVVNFSRRACDRGNRRVKGLAHKIVSRVRCGDIIMLHDLQPRDTAMLETWSSQVVKILAGIQERGLAIEPLEKLIGRPVMKALEEGE